MVANSTKVGRQKNRNLQGEKDAQSLEKHNQNDKRSKSSLVSISISSEISNNIREQCEIFWMTKRRRSLVTD